MLSSKSINMSFIFWIVFAIVIIIVLWNLFSCLFRGAICPQPQIQQNTNIENSCQRNPDISVISGSSHTSPWILNIQDDELPSYEAATRVR